MAHIGVESADMNVVMKGNRAKAHGFLVSHISPDVKSNGVLITVLYS